MRVVIDCRWIRSVKMDGIGRYTFELVRELLLQPERDTIYILLTHDRDVAAWLESHYGLHDLTHVRLHRLPYPVLSLGDVRKLREDLKPLKPDVVLCPNYLSWPFSTEWRTVMVVHDLIPFVMPEVRTTPKWKLFYGIPWFVRSILKKVDSIVTVSEYSAADIQKRFHISKNKISVIAEAAGEQFSREVPEAKKQVVRKRYHLPEHYLLCVSRQQPYKNLIGLAQAYALLSEDLKARYQLVLTGEPHKLYSQALTDALDPLIKSRQAVFTGFVGDDDLPALYQMADLFVMPSLYEGFGLPVLEAMASGCPVASSHAASLPEVGGEAAVYFDPRDSGGMAGVIAGLLHDGEARASMKKRGKKQAQSFTWAQTARAVSNLLHNR